MSNNHAVALNRENITHVQVSTLLNTIATMQHGLREWPTEPNGVPSSSRLDGEGRLALETSLIKACERLDSVLADNARWGIDKLLDIETKLDDTLRNQNAFFDAQRKAADETRRPSHILKPDLMKTPHGWCAFYGDLSNDASLITGIGESPAEAMASFDFAYFRKLAPDEWPVEVTATPIPKPRKPKTR